MEPDPAIVAQLMSMGFGENGSKRAVIATQVAETATTFDIVSRICHYPLLGLLFGGHKT